MEKTKKKFTITVQNLEAQMDFKKLAEEIEYAHYCGKQEERLAKRLESALREVRNETIEECAKYLCQQLTSCDKEGSHLHSVNKQRTKDADAIRRLRKE